MYKKNCTWHCIHIYKKKLNSFCRSLSVKCEPFYSVVILQPQARDCTNHIWFILCKFIKINCFKIVMTIKTTLRGTRINQTNSWQETFGNLSQDISCFIQNNLSFQCSVLPIVLRISRFMWLCLIFLMFLLVQKTRQRSSGKRQGATFSNQISRGRNGCSLIVFCCLSFRLLSCLEKMKNDNKTK